MARTKSENPLGVNVPVRLPPDVKAELQKEADDKGCPLSTLCRMILVEHCKSSH